MVLENLLQKRWENCSFKMMEKRHGELMENVFAQIQLLRLNSMQAKHDLEISCSRTKVPASFTST